MYIIYKHTAPNGKVYIGVTKQTLERRWRNGNGYVKCRLFYRAIQKYGWENISHEILCEIQTEDEASEKERYYISFYKSDNPKFGYNLEDGGYKDRHRSQESIDLWRKKFLKNINRDRLRENAKRQFALYGHPMQGKHLSEETKRKISESRKGKPGHPMSEENKAKIIAAIKGKLRSEEHCRHISEAKKGVYAGDKNPRARRVRCIETGQEFSCAKYAAEWVGVPTGNHNIISACTGNLKTAYGYHWEYA